MAVQLPSPGRSTPRRRNRASLRPQSRPSPRPNRASRRRSRSRSHLNRRNSSGCFADRRTERLCCSSRCLLRGRCRPRPRPSPWAGPTGGAGPPSASASCAAATTDQAAEHPCHPSRQGQAPDRPDAGRQEAARQDPQAEGESGDPLQRRGGDQEGDLEDRHHPEEEGRALGHRVPPQEEAESVVARLRLGRRPRPRRRRARSRRARCREDRQGADFAGETLRVREAAGTLAEVGVGGLKVDRGRVVDRAGDPFGLEVGAQLVAGRGADDVEVEDVVATCGDGGRSDTELPASAWVSRSPASRRRWLASSRWPSLTLRIAAWRPSRRSVRAGISW